MNSTIKTRSKSHTEVTSEFKSAIAEHMRNNNHIMDWDKVKILERESVIYRRKVREACQVRMLEAGISMNRDDGSHELSHIWDPLLRSAPKTSRRSAPSHWRMLASHNPDLQNWGEGEGRGAHRFYQLGEYNIASHLVMLLIQTMENVFTCW